jgi:exonuclease III
MEGNSQHNVIIFGDFNARVGELDVQAVDFQQTALIKNPRQSKDKKVNTQGRTLIQNCKDLNITLLNGRTAKDADGEFTFIGPNGSSTIDLCLTNTIAARKMHSFYVGDQTLSNHCPIGPTAKANDHKPSSCTQMDNIL